MSSETVWVVYLRINDLERIYVADQITGLPDVRSLPSRLNVRERSETSSVVICGLGGINQVPVT